MPMDFVKLHRITAIRKNEVSQGILDLARLLKIMLWWAHQDSNLGQSGYEPEALPTEL